MRPALLVSLVLGALFVAAAGVAQVPQPGADLQVTKTDRPDPVTAGGTVTYTVTVTNRGPERATNVQLQDTLPPGTVFVSSNSTRGNCGQPAAGTGGALVLTCNLGALDPNESATVTIVVRTRNPGTLTNTARVSSRQTDPATTNNLAVETTTVNPRPTTCTITGTAGDDVLLGTPTDDVICALGGDDVIRARDGNDRVNAGAGNDVVYGNAGNDVAAGWYGADVLYGGLGNDRLRGNRGPDTIYGQAGADFLHGGLGFDVVNGGAGTDTCRRGLGGGILIAC